MSLDSTGYEVITSAIHELTDVIGSRMFTRQQLLEYSLSDIVAQTRSQGQTPGQTLSRVLQELRDAGRLRFLGNGKHLLLDDPLNVVAEDYPDDAIVRLLNDRSPSCPMCQ